CVRDVTGTGFDFW
nr:immunoglobulin heavy chain junction region [Macaca mulatta]